MLKPKNRLGCGKNGKEYDYNFHPFYYVYGETSEPHAQPYIAFLGGVGHMSRHAPSFSDNTTSQRSQNRLNLMYGSPPYLPFVSWILYAESCQERGENV